MTIKPQEELVLRSFMPIVLNQQHWSQAWKVFLMKISCFLFTQPVLHKDTSFWLLVSSHNLYLKTAACDFKYFLLLWHSATHTCVLTTRDRVMSRVSEKKGMEWTKAHFLVPSCARATRGGPLNITYRYPDQAVPDWPRAPSAVERKNRQHHVLSFKTI